LLAVASPQRIVSRSHFGANVNRLKNTIMKTTLHTSKNVQANLLFATFVIALVVCAALVIKFATVINLM
jgi:hypothetical protein